MTRYNLYAAADVLGDVAPGVSSGQVVKQMELLAAKNLPASFSYEWTEVTLQQKLAGNTAAYISLCACFSCS